MYLYNIIHTYALHVGSICVRTYVFMYVYVCMYVGLYMYVRKYYVSMFCIYVCAYLCRYVFKYVCSFLWSRGMNNYQFSVTCYLMQYSDAKV